ncbi:hypothetical protein ACS0TY_025781 [Phlomoides rotata]
MQKPVHRTRETMSLPQKADDDAILETRESPPSHFLMRVESFSLLGKNGIHKYESGEFTAGRYKWRLILYPNEKKTGIDSKYVSVYLAISDTASLQPANWMVGAVFSIFLLNQISGNYHYSSARTRRFMAMKLEWGISNFISKKTLMAPSNGFLVDNNCVFGAEVFILKKSPVYECLSVKDVSAVPFKRDWKISNFSNLGDVWTSEQFVAGGHNWEVLLYPKGNGHQKGRYLASFLRLVDSKRVNARFSLSIRDQINYKHDKCTELNFMVLGPNLQPKSRQDQLCNKN